MGFQAADLESAKEKKGAKAHLLAVDLRPVPAGFLRRHLERVPNAEKMLTGTSLESTGKPINEWLAKHWPDTLTIRDYLTIVGNLATIGPEPAYHIEYAEAGVPLFAGGLDIGMRFAPTAYDALALMCKYGSERPGYLQYLLYEEGDATVFEVCPATSLGAAAPILYEMTILVVSRTIDRHHGSKKTLGLVEFSHHSPQYLRRLKEALSKQIVFNARRSSLSIPTRYARAASMVHDEDQWRLALRTCEEERAQRAEEDGLAEVRREFARQVLQEGRPPKLSTLADALGVSDRTLIRRFRAAGISFQQFKDRALFSRATELLLASDLNIEKIAEQLGFADASGLHRSFKRWIGRTPRQYREAQRSQSRVGA